MQQKQPKKRTLSSDDNTSKKQKSQDRNLSEVGSATPVVKASQAKPASEDILEFTEATNKFMRNWSDPNAKKSMDAALCEFFPACLLSCLHGKERQKLVSQPAKPKSILKPATFETMRFDQYGGYCISVQVSNYDYDKDGITVFLGKQNTFRQLTKDECQKPLQPLERELTLLLPKVGKNDEDIEEDRVFLKNENGITWEELFKALSKNCIDIDFSDHCHYEGFLFNRQKQGFELCLGS
jgi:hypothetical protein